MKIPLAIVSALLAATPASAEIYGGLLAHGLNTPITAGTDESGVDLEIGLRTAPIDSLRAIGRPSAHVMASINSGKGADFVAAGLNWKFGRRFYLRPGIGIALQDGPTYRVRGRYRTDLGSSVLFEPELSAGIQLTERTSVEASWVHLSHAKLFSRNNPGLDMIGLRFALALH